MPNSTRPRRPFKGNKFLVTSKEYQDLNLKLHQVVQQLQQVQAVLMTMLAGPAANDATVEPIATRPDVTQEEWDQYERDMDERARQVAVATEAKEAQASAMAPQEAV